MIFPFKIYECNKNENIFPQILAIIIASMAALMSGLLLSWPSPFIGRITKDKENYDVTEDEAAYFAIIPPIVMMLTCPVFCQISDQIGRKKTLMFCAFFGILAWLMTIISNKVWILYLSRVCFGALDGCFLSCLPVYIGEISTPKIRGSWGNVVSVSLVFGGFLINAIGSYYDVRQTAYICLPVPVAYIVLMWYMPESPYFLLMKGQEQNAKSSLLWLRGEYEIDKAYSQLKADVDRQMSETGTWKDLFFIKTNRKALSIGILLRSTQQLGGPGAFAAYLKVIFDHAGLNVGSEVPSMVTSGCATIAVAISGYVVERFGRRKSYIGSLAGCATVLCLLAIHFYIQQNLQFVDLSSFDWVPITGMILYVISSSFGIVNVPTLMAGELFSTSIKAKASIISISVFGLCMFFSYYIFSVLIIKQGLYAPFLYFGVINYISSLLSYWLVPETKGKTLEEIQLSLGGSELRGVPTC